MPTRTILLTTVLLAATAAGCGDDDEGATTGGQDPSSESTAESTTSSPSASPAALELAESSFGDIIVDAEGYTVYLFTNDEDGTSTCVDACADLWPPLEAPEDATVGEGLDEALLGTITRDDGSVQLTYAGAPLYGYTPDGSPGDTTGQGVGGVWYVLDADGQAITGSAEGADEADEADDYRP